MANRRLYTGLILSGLFLVSSCYVRSRPQPVAVAPTPPVYRMPPPPPWAPPYYNTQQVRYYYLPDMQCYYDVYMQQYVYFDGFQWIHSPYAPAAYSGYDMNNSYVIVLNQNVNDPWTNHNTYVNTYPRGVYNQGGNPTGGNATQPRRGYNENDRTVLIPSPGTKGGQTNPPAKKEQVKPNMPVQEKEQNSEKPGPQKHTQETEPQYEKPAPEKHSRQSEQPAQEIKATPPPPRPKENPKQVPANQPQKPAKKTPGNPPPGKQQGQKQGSNGN